jgi:hypothetical protein
LRALAAADQLTDERAAQAGVTSPVAAFYPSLYLNLAECYHKLGDLEEARRHLRRGSAVVSTLPDDGYDRMIKRALDRLNERLPPPWPHADAIGPVIFRLTEEQSPADGTARGSGNVSDQIR